MRRREVARLVKEVEKAGCTVRKGGSGHYVITTPSGTVVSLSQSPSDWRYRKNFLADLRRGGVNLEEVK
jgi:hypothetical protein